MFRTGINKYMKKIAIIGGGISSLSAAYYISRNQNLRNIHIFEKEKELGGRVKYSPPKVKTYKKYIY